MKTIDAVNVHNSLKNHILLDGYPFVLDLENSKGSYLADATSGKKYLDVFTCFASMPLGYNHPEMIEDEFVNEIGRIAVNKPSNSDLYSSVYASFVDLFFRKAVPKEFVHSFYIAGGALAVENAIKAAIDWKKRKNLNRGMSSKKGEKIIYLNEAFHGRSGYTLTVTNTLPDKVMLFPRLDWIKVSNPKMIFPLIGNNLSDTENAESRSLSEIKKAIEKNPNDIAAILIEPIQGEGGDNHLRDEYLQAIRELCDENDILLIFDEVQTGGGLTGTFWAHEQLGVTPDLLAFGKKMQVCGVLATKRLDEVPLNVFRRSSRINSTWGGDLVDMYRSQKYIELIYRDNIFDHVKEMGTYLSIRLVDICSKHQRITANPRNRGLFAAFDIDQFVRADFLSKCMEKGLLILKCGKQSIRFRPPLNISKEELDTALNIIDEVLTEIGKR
ncbi:MAG: L-lysine 6-transaminase [Candidatus Kapaibacteriales bacterium]